jgi:pyridoxal phosphate enzyme (YggS family)
VQELVDKQSLLPKDIEWHMIGHLQKNKVKYIAPFISLIHSVDNISLLRKIDKEAKKNDRIIDVLFQLRIAKEETKFGMDKDTLLEATSVYKNDLKHVRLCGLMGMASFIQNEVQIQQEFDQVMDLYHVLKQDLLKEEPAFQIRSMGMSGDYKLAIDRGANMIRIGTLLFGARN